MSIIKLDGVSYKYQDGTHYAIDNLSLQIDKGEFICILGVNGSGKSTLARLLNGLLVPEKGEVEVFGKSTKDQKSVFEIRKKVGVVFQNPDNQTVATMVEDDVAFAPENIGLPSEEIGRRIDFALKSTNMEKYRYFAGQKLSGGQKQRIAIAGVLALKPDVIVLDESTSMLDGVGREDVMKVAKSLNDEGITVISITHYMEEAVKASRVIVLDEGRIVMDGTPKQIFSQPKEVEKYGLMLPRATYVANELKKQGLNVKDDILDEKELIGELCKLFQKN